MIADPDEIQHLRLQEREYGLCPKCGHPSEHCLCVDGGTNTHPKTVKIMAPDGTVSEETVNHPQHYGGKDNPYEVIKVIRAWGLGFSLGNSVKYIARAGKKDPAKKLEDLKKAVFYLQEEISQMEPTPEDKPKTWKKSGHGRLRAAYLLFLSTLIEISKTPGTVSGNEAQKALKEAEHIFDISNSEFGAK